MGAVSYTHLDVYKRQPAMTTRGLKENEFREVAKIIVAALKNEAPQEELKQRVLDMLQNFPLYK